MKIIINGESHSFDHGMPVSDLLDHFRLDPDTVVVEINQAIVKKENYGSTKALDRDLVEILRFVGGG